MASLVNFQIGNGKNVVNLFRINRISILFRDIDATRNARVPLRNIWRDNSSKNRSLVSVSDALKIPLIRIISGESRASDSGFRTGFHAIDSRGRTFACTIDNLVYRPVMTSLLSYSRADYFLEV